MSAPMPELAGIEHSDHDLPTGVRVHLAAAGPEDAPPVLALHGWPQHWWCWRDVVAALDGEFRMLCPDMRGFGWSGWPADGLFTKQRVADDAIALLDALGVEQVRLVGHDWGGWAALLAALAAPERFSSLLVLSVGHPWVPRSIAAKNTWRLAYQLPLATPVLGERVAHDGRYLRAVLETARRDGVGWTHEAIETYVAPLREPDGARASARLYRDFLLRELPAAAGGNFRGRRPAMPARLMVGRREPLGLYVLEGFPGDVEVVDGAGHFLPEEAPAIVGDRIRAAD
jgi:pimeloyl-ACP methyl ester carboxylesterase